jgi:predicted CoA-substrate-specific enzyme activase
MSAPAFLGVDVGSTTTKALLLDAELRALGSRLLRTGHEPRAAADRLRAELLAAAGLASDAAVPTVATGYGRALVGWAGSTVTEITCHARGVRHLCPGVRTVVDIGGQDSKVIRLDEQGLVQDFAMNDRCAAGTGAFLDVIAGRFGLTLEDLGRLHERGAEPLDVSSTCVVFAETEVVGLISQGRRLDDVLAGVHRAVARRVAATVRQLGAVEPIWMSGGVALNETVRRELELAVGRPVRRSPEPQLTAAWGAALIAAETKRPP